jgi:hypothetical protein
MARPQLRYRVTPSGAYDALAPERTNTAPAAAVSCIGICATGSETSNLAGLLDARDLASHSWKQVPGSSTAWCAGPWA